MCIIMSLANEHTLGFIPERSVIYEPQQVAYLI